MEIVQERLEREYGLELITTAPSVVYKVITTAQDELYIDNPANLPPAHKIEEIEEPYVRATIFVPADLLGPVMDLATERRGIPARSALRHPHQGAGDIRHPAFGDTLRLLR